MFLNDAKIYMKDHPRNALAIQLKKNTDDLLEVLRILAHKLSQPLTSLHGSVEVALMREFDESEGRRVLKLALQESERMAETLGSLREILEIGGAAEGFKRVSWTQSVKHLLQEAVINDENHCSRLVRDVQDGVWVLATPQHLNAATSRLISAAVKAARGKRLVRIALSAFEGTACLSVCEEGVSADARPFQGKDMTEHLRSLLELGHLDEWVVRRAAECLGGRLEFDPASAACRAYHMNLPLANSVVETKTCTL